MDKVKGLIEILRSNSQFPVVVGIAITSILVGLSILVGSVEQAEAAPEFKTTLLLGK